MGIQGLIPFIEKASNPTNVSEFSGGTAAIDAYCWLHKGVFSCADKLIRGEDSDMYVNYCMKFINMLLAKNIKPILVFDGQRLPAKKETEEKRRECRDQNRKKAVELMRLDKRSEALTYIRRCIDVTHNMASKLIRSCRSRNIDCIVAPYEADAQLAFLNINHYADVVITEDSDLLLFGARKILFKLDINGNGLLCDQSKLHAVMDMKEIDFSLDKFRYMCILSGCDYLASLPGIGLVKACRFIKTTRDTDIARAITRIGLHLNMNRIKVTKEYVDGFLDANFMFKHQPVFDPKSRCLVPLSEIDETDEEFARKWSELLDVKNLSEHQYQNLAYGNLDPMNLNKIDNWNPSHKVSINECNSKFSNITRHQSIWEDNFEPRKILQQSNRQIPNALCSAPRKYSFGTKSNESTFGSSNSTLSFITNDEDSDSMDIEIPLESNFTYDDHDNETEENGDNDEDNDIAAYNSDISSSILSDIDVDNLPFEDNTVRVVPKRTHINPFSKASNTSTSTCSNSNKGALSRFASILKVNNKSSEDNQFSNYFKSITQPDPLDGEEKCSDNDAEKSALEILAIPDDSTHIESGDDIVKSSPSPTIKTSRTKLRPSSLIKVRRKALINIESKDENELEPELIDEKNGNEKIIKNTSQFEPEKKKPRTPSSIQKLSAFRKTPKSPHFKWEGPLQSKIISYTDTTPKAKDSSPSSGDAKVTSVSPSQNSNTRLLSSQKSDDDDEGFGSWETNSSESSCGQSISMAELNKETDNSAIKATSYRRPGLSKPVPTPNKKLSLLKFHFMPPQKLKN